MVATTVPDFDGDRGPGGWLRPDRVDDGRHVHGARPCSWTMGGSWSSGEWTRKGRSPRSTTRRLGPSHRQDAIRTRISKSLTRFFSTMGGCWSSVCPKAATFHCSVEIYDPDSGSFRSIEVPQGEGSAAVGLSDGRVLVVGGELAGDGLNAALVFDPRLDSFTATGLPNVDRHSAVTATLLDDGRVLVAGGEPSGTAEIYDPQTGTFTLTGSLSTARDYFTATRLVDGRVFIVGGSDEGSAALASAEIYDPETGTFTPTGPMATARFWHAVAPLPDGRVLVVGGGDGGGDRSVEATAEIYDPPLVGSPRRRRPPRAGWRPPRCRSPMGGCWCSGPPRECSRPQCGLEVGGDLHAGTCRTAGRVLRRQSHRDRRDRNDRVPPRQGESGDPGRRAGGGDGSEPFQSGDAGPSFSEGYSVLGTLTLPRDCDQGCEIQVLGPGEDRRSEVSVQIAYQGTPPPASGVDHLLDRNGSSQYERLNVVRFLWRNETDENPRAIISGTSHIAVTS